MARTLTRQEQDDMTTRTLTGEELARLNYLCFIEWGENLDGVRQMVTIARRLRRSTHKNYMKRKEKRKTSSSQLVFVDPDGVQHTMTPLADYHVTPTVDYSSASASSLKTESSETSPREAAERVRKVLTPPDSSPKISYSLKSTPTPSPVTCGYDMMEVLPTGTHSSNYIRCKE